MSQQNPTIIVGHLDDSELTKSIDKLVNEVANKTTIMAGKFTSAIGKMQDAMKDFAVTQKVSVDLMKEAWRDMSKSFDAMVAAQSAATGGGKGSGKASAPNTIGALKEEISMQQKKVDEQIRGTAEAQKEVNIHRKLQEQLKEETKSTAQRAQESAKRTLKNVLSLPQNDLREAEYRLKALLNTVATYKTKKSGILSEEQWHRLNNAIAKTQQQIDKLQEKKPKSLNDVLGMDANSIDQIAAKLRALKMVRIDPNNAAEVKSVGDAYAELKRKQAQLMGQNIQLTHSNNYLAQSFGYIRNRIVYALTLGAITNFIKQLYEIRGQYELLERSLGVLVGSFEKGTQIFNELNEMAIKSPFTLIELGTAAKQLTAYNFAANEVVDTTRRLADISAALGVPMERLTYNLGQIKAQGVLNARDARDFANAGLAIVPMLAKMYTEQKTFGDEMVTTAKVYDMMSKKMVTYSDVLKVLYRVTDEGGKFFDFQAKQADTLRVQMANLTLAYNNMLNEIGSENQGLLTAWVSGLKTLLKNWKEISRAILTLITTLGTYKAVSAIVAALNSKMFVGSVLVGLRNYILGIKNATGAMATFNAVTKGNPIAFLISSLVAAIGYFALFNHKVKETTVEMERFGENASKQIKKVETLGKVLAGIEEGSSTYKKALSDLNQIVSEYGVTEIKNRDEINSKIQQTIQLIKEEGKERQYANNIAKGEERYINDTGQAKSSLNEGLLGLEGWFGTTSKVRKEILDNAEAITDVASSIIEENIGLVVNKTGQEAYDGLIEIQNRVRRGLKNSGLSNSAIDFILDKGYINSAIKDYRIAAEEHERYNQKIKGYYDAATKATQSTMTFTEKVNANARALRNNTDDAVSLYNRIYDIVKIAKENHTINFDLKLSAEKPPKWMFDKSLPELQQLAERFTAIAQSGGSAKGYDRQGTYERGLMYASAARIKQEEEERNARNKDHKTRTKQSDEIAKAIKDEISLVKQLQSAYDTLTKKGDSHANAIAKVQDLYGKTINLLNKDMDKFGLPRLDLSIIKGNNHNEVLAFFEKLRNVLESKGLSNLERMEAVEGVVKEFRLKADTYNLDMITKGLNNELGKLKDEYELAVELDANPEMGNMFTEMFDIDTSDFPKTINDYMQRVQNEFDNARKSLNLAAPLDIFKASNEDWYNWGKAVNYSEEQVDNFKKSFDGAVGVAKKWAQDTVKSIQDLEYKLGDLAKKVEIEEAKLAVLEDEAAKNTNAAQKRLLELRIQEQKEAIEKLKMESVKLLPFYEDLFGDMYNISVGKLKEIAKTAREVMSPRSSDNGVGYTQRTNEKGKVVYDIFSKDKNGQIKKTTVSLEEFIKINKQIDSVQKKIAESSPWEKIKDSFSKTQEGKIKNIASGIEAISGELGKMGQLTGIVAEIFSAFGNPNEFDETSEILGDIGTTMEGLATAGQGVAKIYSGDIIGGATDVVKGLWTSVSTWFDNTDKRIQQEIKDSERAVKRLENAYKELEYAAGNAFGAATSGAQEAIKANKELQLVELKRQLALEQSRDGKHRDEDRIIEIKGQIIDLEHEINDFTKNAVNELLGISSHGDFFESMISEMIEAFKNGEDAMEVFEEKWSDMIDNMIMKSIVSQVLSQWVKTLEHGADEILEKYTEESSKKMSDLASKITNLRTMDAGDASEWIYDNDRETFNKILESLGVENVGDMIGVERLAWFNKAWGSGLAKKIMDAYLAMLDNNMAGLQDKLDKESLDATGELIDYYGEAGKEFKENYLGQILDKIQENWNFGKDSEKQLSNLQQGIQGITEDTAGALEAYMNGVSQQVYLQSDLLTQIRDAVVGFDMDVQTATMGEILLQLRSSYEVQMAIHGILEGWNNPSGQAVRVELVS